MTSTNFLVATVDRQFNLFKHKDGQRKFIEPIAEHIKRLEEISENHHFYIDDAAFEALGRKNFPLRFTRVFTSNCENIPHSKSYRTHHIDTLREVIESKERFSPSVQIFFIGSAPFLLEASKWAKKLLLTVVDKAYNDDEETKVISKLPLSDFQKIFTKRRSIHPEMLEQIKAYKKIISKKKKIQKVVIADNGMKVISTETVEEFDPNDEILNTPDYMFYEFSK